MFHELVKSSDAKSFVKTLIMFIILIAISTLLLRFLWNESLVKHITILTPVSGFGEALLLSIALSVIKGCC